MRGTSGQPRLRRGTKTSGLGRLWLLPVLAWAAGCAPALMSLPAGPGAPVPGFADILQQATAACGSVRTFSAEIAVAGRLGSRRVRGRLLAGLDAPDGLRLEGLAPFGGPVFVLVARAGRATLLLPRDGRVLRGAEPGAVLEALTGLTLSPADLLAIVSGCGVARRTPVSARAYGRDWLRVDLAAGARLYLRREDGAWRLVAAVEPRAGHDGLRIEYGAMQQGPKTLRLIDGDGRLDLRLTLSQVDLNVPLNPRAFRVRVPDDAAPITLDELRRLGLLGGGTDTDTHAPSR
ncbi:MAG TPA: hypothetical protein VNE16_14185 [Vicinamibacterales bacterium]|nr:hypothetical protein [Vicinamibacterales bacterium]